MIATTIRRDEVRMPEQHLPTVILTIRIEESGATFYGTLVMYMGEVLEHIVESYTETEARDRHVRKILEWMSKGGSYDWS